MRTTFATMLSASGTFPRTAQAALRHSDIKLTMGTDTDPKLLDVRQAIERLPDFAPQRAELQAVPVRKAGSENAHDCADTRDPKGQLLAPADTIGQMTSRLSEERANRENAGNVSEKPSMTLSVTEGQGVERRRVELPASSLRTKRSTS